jgi:hypothetical protein
VQLPGPSTKSASRSGLSPRGGGGKAAAASPGAGGVGAGRRAAGGTEEGDGAALVQQVQQLKGQAQDLLVRMAQLRTAAWHAY